MHRFYFTTSLPFRHPDRTILQKGDHSLRHARTMGWFCLIAILKQRSSDRGAFPQRCKGLSVLHLSVVPLSYPALALVCGWPHGGYRLLSTCHIPPIPDVYLRDIQGGTPLQGAHRDDYEQRPGLNQYRCNNAEVL